MIFEKVFIGGIYGPVFWFVQDYCPGEMDRFHMQTAANGIKEYRFRISKDNFKIHRHWICEEVSIQDSASSAATGCDNRCLCSVKLCVCWEQVLWRRVQWHEDISGFHSRPGKVWFWWVYVQHLGGAHSRWPPGREGKDNPPENLNNSNCLTLSIQNS